MTASIPSIGIADDSKRSCYGRYLLIHILLTNISIAFTRSNQSIADTLRQLSPGYGMTTNQSTAKGIYTAASARRSKDGDSMYYRGMDMIGTIQEKLLLNESINIKTSPQKESARSPSKLPYISTRSKRKTSLSDDSSSDLNAKPIPETFPLDLLTSRSMQQIWTRSFYSQTISFRNRIALSLGHLLDILPSSLAVCDDPSNALSLSDKMSQDYDIYDRQLMENDGLEGHMIASYHQLISLFIELRLACVEFILKLRQRYEEDPSASTASSSIIFFSDPAVYHLFYDHNMKISVLLMQQYLHLCRQHYLRSTSRLQGDNIEEMTITSLQERLEAISSQFIDLLGIPLLMDGVQGFIERQIFLEMILMGNQIASSAWHHQSAGMDRWKTIERPSVGSQRYNLTLRDIRDDLEELKHDRRSSETVDQAKRARSRNVVSDTDRINHNQRVQHVITYMNQLNQQAERIKEINETLLKLWNEAKEISSENSKPWTRYATRISITVVMSLRGIDSIIMQIGLCEYVRGIGH